MVFRIRFERFMRRLLSCISQYNECNVNQSSLIKLLERGCYTKNSEKNFTIEDLSTLRDISLLPVCYKILSKAICNRIIPIISSKIDFWQRAFFFFFYYNEIQYKPPKHEIK